MQNFFSNHQLFQTKSKIRFIDLFAGIGGFHLALHNQGAKCVFASEWDEKARQTYEINFKKLSPNIFDRYFAGDITQVNIDDIPNHDILCAGFPCQPFSISGKQKGFNDVRGTLFFNILEIIQAKQPKVVFLENVKHLVHHDNGNTLKVIIEKLENLGYKTTWKVLNAKDFGLAQNRERIIIIANKDKYFNFSKIKQKKNTIIHDILDNDNSEYLSIDEYTLLDKDIWKEQKSGLIFCGYRNKSIRANGTRPNTKHLSRVHKQPNRIYHADGTHPTLPSQETSGRFFIYDGKGVRKLTIDECYKLQGFPKDFIKNPQLSACYNQIGNSVAVPMIEEIYKQIMEQYLMSEFDYKDKLIEINKLSFDISDIKLNIKIIQPIEYIASRIGKNKGVYTVLITLAFYKYLHPKQDIRQHKIELPNGFSGRSFDTKYITPTLKELNLPAMAESGWLTRSLEQAQSYDMDFKGKITPKELKNAFLNTVANINKSPEQAYQILRLLLNAGIQFQQQNKVEIQKIQSDNIQIYQIINILKSHFEFNYKTHGGSKLPVLAFYAIYKILLNELDRFENCKLAPLGSHTASDRTSKSGGDIEIFKNNQPFEVLEIKLDKKPTAHMVRIAYDKINQFGISRYYILSAFNPSDNELLKINELITHIEREHGCQVIVNGLYPTLKYYLRLISNPSIFLNTYIDLVKKDKELQIIHKNKLKDLITKLN